MRRHLYLSGCFNKERLSATRHEATIQFLLPSFLWCFLAMLVTASWWFPHHIGCHLDFRSLVYHLLETMKQWSNLQSPLSGDTQPIFALRQAFAGRSWCKHLCWRCGAWGRHLRCDSWWLGTIQSHCGLLFRKLWGKFLTWLALMVRFLWVYGSMALHQKKGREERWNHVNSLKPPKNGWFEEWVFLLQGLHFQVPPRQHRSGHCFSVVCTKNWIPWSTWKRQVL